ncbi:hypothetical protein ACWDRX_22570 [Streptomyces nigra]
MRATTEEFDLPSVGLPFDARLLTEDRGEWLREVGQEVGTPFLVSPMFEYDVVLNSFFQSPGMRMRATTPGHVDEWSVSLTGERHLAPSTIRGYQGIVRLFSEYLTDSRYGWGPACEEAFGTFPVAVCHEWNTIAHLNDYEGDPEAKPFTREQLQLFLD